MEEKNIDTEVLEMAQTEQQKKEANRAAVKKYREAKDYFSIRPSKELGDAIRRAATAETEQAGKKVSVQSYILGAVEARIAGGSESSAYTVDLGAELGERTETMAKAQGVTLEEYVREAVSAQRLRDLRTISVEFGKAKDDSKNHPNE